MSETLWGHPKGLAVCFFTEVWERFAYFGTLSLLILYLTKSYGLSDADGNRMVGTFGAMVWMLPVIGGAIADRWLGSRKSVVLGSLLLTVGYASIALPGGVFRALDLDSGPNGLPPLGFLFFSMAVVVVGVGFLKSNVASVVGSLYTNVAERDVGIFIFYWSFGAGGALGPFVCSAVGEAYGLRYGLSVAGGGMLIALLTFLWGQKYLSEHTGPPSPERIERKVAPGLSLEHGIYLAGVLSVLVVWQLFKFHNLVPSLLVGFAFVLLLAITYFTIWRCEPDERANMIVVGALLLSAILFAAISFQAYGSLLLFADRYVDRRIFGFEYAAPMIITFGSSMALFTLPFVTMLFAWLEKRGRPVSFAAKFAIGLLLMGLTFLVPALAVVISGDTAPLHSGWIFLLVFLLVLGDLCVVPAALSMMPTVCPKRVVAMMIGAFYFTLAVGNSWGGEIAARMAMPEAQANGGPVDFEVGLNSFVSLYTLMGSVGLLGGLVLFALVPFLSRQLTPVR